MMHRYWLVQMLEQQWEAEQMLQLEAADVVFMNSSVEAIPQSIAIAKKTGSIAIQNVVFALVIKALVMVFGLLGLANMWMAVFADTGVAVICILNAIRILYKKL